MEFHCGDRNGVPWSFTAAIVAKCLGVLLSNRNGVPWSFTAAIVAECFDRPAMTSKRRTDMRVMARYVHLRYAYCLTVAWICPGLATVVPRTMISVDARGGTIVMWRPVVSTPLGTIAISYYDRHVIMPNL